MALDTSKVREVAFLARIRVPEEALESLAGELNTIIGWVEQLEEADTKGIEPMTSATGVEAPMRLDEVSVGNCQDEVLANATESENGFYTVPKVVE